MECWYHHSLLVKGLGSREHIAYVPIKGVNDDVSPNLIYGWPLKRYYPYGLTVNFILKRRLLKKKVGLGAYKLRSPSNPNNTGITSTIYNLYIAIC
jgi:hypothetical protein